MVQYSIISEQLQQDGFPYTSYGISSSDGTIIHDITTEGIRLARFVSKLNRLDLSPVHLADAVENFLAEMSDELVRCTVLLPAENALRCV